MAVNESKTRLGSPSWGKWHNNGALGTLVDGKAMPVRKIDKEILAPVILNGVLEFYSETGTEGGYWAFQDERFISKVAPEFGVFGGSIVFDAKQPGRKGRSQVGTHVLHGDKWDPLPDPLEEEEDYVKSSLFQGELSGDLEADKRLMEKYGFRIKYAADRMDENYGEGKWNLEDSDTAVLLEDGTRVHFGGTPSTDPQRPYGVSKGGVTRNTIAWEDGVVEERLSTDLLVEGWSYEGLHVLNNGDKLTIFDKDDLTKVLWEGVISLSASTNFMDDAFGLWIHNDQLGISRETWATWFMGRNPAKLELGKKSLKQQRKS